MSRSSLIGALALVVALSGLLAARPATAAEACKTPGGVGRTAIVDFGTATPADDDRMAALMVQGMDPALATAAMAPPTCSRREFQVGSTTYVFGGENQDRIPRTAKPAGGQTGASMAYLSPMPTGNPENRPYVLIVRKASGLEVALRVYLNILKDEDLQRDFQRALTITEGNQLNGALAVFEPSSRQVVLRVGSRAPRTLREADGQVFAAAENGAVRHKASGVVCPAQLAGRTIEGMGLNGSGPNSASCVWGKPNTSAWISFFFDPAPAASLEDYVRQSVAAAQSFSPGSRAATAPVPARPNVQQAYWTDNAGNVQGIVAVKSGTWLLTLRVSYQPADEASARAMITTLLDNIAGATPGS